VEITFNKTVGPSVADAIRKLGGRMKRNNGVDSVILPNGMTREAFAAAIAREMAALPNAGGSPISAPEFRDFDAAVRDILDQVLPDTEARPGETPIQHAKRTNGHKNLPVRH